MQTERIAVVLRPRHGWEAIDLGFRMVRSWWRPLFGTWLLVVWPFAIALHLLLFDQPLIAFAIIWWLKPLYDRIALQVLGEALFGRVPGVRSTLAALPRLLRSGVVGSLLWLRPSPLRAVHLPVLQLERLRGLARLERTRVLIGRQTLVALGLHFVCLGFELIVFLGLAQFVGMFAPEAPGAGDWEILLDGNVSSSIQLYSALYLLAMTLVEPFYVGGGFGLYINRRVYLEGWDIDLVFRRLARRVSRGAARAPAPGLVLGLLSLLVAAPPARAEESSRPAIECRTEEPEDAGECIARILERPEFATTREVSYWWPRRVEEHTGPEAPPSELLVALVDLLSRLVRGFTWLALALALGAIAYWIGRARLPEGDGEGPDRNGATHVGIDPQPEPLPDDVVSAALERWRAGDPTGALGLLYRGAIRHLGGAAGLDLPVWATEDECDRIARRQLEEALARDFATLTRAWQYCAYGGRIPEEGAFHELCDRWRPRLGVAS